MSTTPATIEGPVGYAGRLKLVCFAGGFSYTVTRKFPGGLACPVYWNTGRYERDSYGIRSAVYELFEALATDGRIYTIHGERFTIAKRPDKAWAFTHLDSGLAVAAPDGGHATQRAALEAAVEYVRRFDAKRVAEVCSRARKLTRKMKIRAWAEGVPA